MQNYKLTKLRLLYYSMLVVVHVCISCKLLFFFAGENEQV